MVLTSTMAYATRPVKSAKAFQGNFRITCFPEKNELKHEKSGNCQVQLSPNFVHLYMSNPIAMSKTLCCNT